MTVVPDRDQDRDSLHVLPLSIIPLESHLFQQMRMVKNVHLESVVELFGGKETGSGQIRVEALQAAYDSVPHADIGLLNKLAQLNSYDVYSLRILLRKQGIDVDDGELSLSEGKQNELTRHMRAFTRPLISYIYGDEHLADQNIDIISLFSHPDLRKAKHKLIAFSDKLGIPLESVPKFLEEYGDIFLSISYYRQAYSGIHPILADFQESIEEIKTNRLLQHDRTRVENCMRVRGIFTDMTASVRQRIKTFEFGSRNMWVDIDASKFRKFSELVHNNHTMLGGVLCALTLKLEAWKTQFPDRQFGGPMKRVEFIANDMQQGLEKFRKPRVNKLRENIGAPIDLRRARSA
ncbi:MAG: hypothetical protein H8E94_01015 [Alphaproteobacteria bacterium]|nr:hypothetical protein [Alphaproteobacteria bacterium]